MSSWKNKFWMSRVITSCFKKYLNTCWSNKNGTAWHLFKSSVVHGDGKQSPSSRAQVFMTASRSFCRIFHIWGHILKTSSKSPKPSNSFQSMAPSKFLSAEVTRDCRIILGWMLELRRRVVRVKKLSEFLTLEKCWQQEWEVEWVSQPLEEVLPVVQNPQQSPSSQSQSCLACPQRTGKCEELSPVPLSRSLGLHRSYKTEIVVSLEIKHFVKIYKGKVHKKRAKLFKEFGCVGTAWYIWRKLNHKLELCSWRRYFHKE